jgi:hypothetical protein
MSWQNLLDATGSALFAFFAFLIVFFAVPERLREGRTMWLLSADGLVIAAVGWTLRPYLPIDKAWSLPIGISIGALIAPMVTGLSEFQDFLSKFRALTSGERDYVFSRELMPAEEELRWARNHAATLLNFLQSEDTESATKELDFLIGQLDALGPVIEGVRQENLEMKSQMESASQPYFATAEIKNRLRDQAAAATSLHREANHRTILFQKWGFVVITVGLVLVASGAIVSWTVHKDLQGLVFVGPIVGIVFNVVGSGLILFHKTAARTALEYFDRKQRLDNSLTALELLTNPVMRAQQDTVLPEFVRKLFNGESSRQASDE